MGYSKTVPPHIMKTITKTTKRYPHDRSPYGDNLTRQESYDLEKRCLQRIHSNYKCKCGLNCNHFPILKSCDSSKFKFVLSDCGSSFRQLKKHQCRTITVKHMERQLDCIADNLRKSHVQHGDMHHSGKNLCVSREGVISVIDFDIARIGKRFVDDRWCGNFKKKIRDIISQKKVAYT